MSVAPLVSPAQDPMATSPDRFGRTPSGSMARAWLRDLDAVRAAAGVSADDDAMLASWIIEAPHAHPIWHSYNLTLIHLRPTPRWPHPIIYLSGATHEVMLHALDPSAPREPMLRTDAMTWLTPPNFGAQLVEPSDQAAIARVNATVDLVLEGRLNPDTDARRDWITLFGDAMIRPEHRA